MLLGECEWEDISAEEEAAIRWGLRLGDTDFDILDAEDVGDHPS